MRQIKFRGKRKDNGQWGYGWFVGGRHATIWEPCNNYDGTVRAGRWFEVLYETVGQFTGLLDKNKKDSYDGDKIRTSNCGDVVIEWNDNTSCFGFYYKSKSGKSWVPLYRVAEFEVIGNIHEEQK